MILGRLWCWAVGHRRGVRVSGPIGAMINGVVVSERNVNFYRCPRCSATWTRKVKAAKVDGNTGTVASASALKEIATMLPSFNTLKRNLDE